MKVTCCYGERSTDCNLASSCTCISSGSSLSVRSCIDRHIAGQCKHVTCVRCCLCSCRFVYDIDCDHRCNCLAACYTCDGFHVNLALGCCLDRNRTDLLICSSGDCYITSQICGGGIISDTNCNSGAYTNIRRICIVLILFFSCCCMAVIFTSCFYINVVCTTIAFDRDLRSINISCCYIIDYIHRNRSAKSELTGVKACC